MASSFSSAAALCLRLPGRGGLYRCYSRCDHKDHKKDKCTRGRQWKINTGEPIEMVHRALAKWLLDADKYKDKAAHIDAPRH